MDSSSSSSRLKHIASAERVDVIPEVIETLINASSGDLRRAITYLQSASRLSSSTSPPTPITPIDIQEIAGVVPENVINDFAAVLGIEIVGNMEVDEPDGNTKKGFETIKNKVKFLMREGYSATQILNQVYSTQLLADYCLTNEYSFMIWSFCILRLAGGKNHYVLLYLRKQTRLCVMELTKNYGYSKLV